MAEERIRPLRWVKGIGKLDPQQVQRLLQRLFREGPSVVMELEELGCKMLDELTGSSHTKPHDESIIVLSAMFFDGSAASRSLLCDGYVRAGCSQIRFMIETMLVAEFLHDSPRRAKEWDSAKSTKERRSFSFEAIYREVENSEFWKEWWDQLNEVVHSNRRGAPAQYRTRPIIGIDVYIGPFYDPVVIARLFLEVLALCQWHTERLSRWYSQLLSPDLAHRLSSINGVYYSYAEQLLARADEEWEKIRSEPGTISLEEQQRAVEGLGLPRGSRQDRERTLPFDLPRLPHMTS